MPARLDNLRVVDPVLTTIARGYSNEEFIGEKLFPVVNVDKSAGKIPLFGKESFKVWETERALRADSNEMEGAWLTTTAFSTEEHDLVQRLDYLEIEEAMLNLETRAVESVMEAIALKKEKMYADLVQTLGNYPTDNKVTLTDDFYNEDAIDWIIKIGDACNNLSAIIGRDPNTIVIPRKVWSHLRFHPKLKSYLGVNVSGSELFNVKASVEKLAGMLEIPNVLIGSARYTTDLATFSNIWTNNIVLAYITPPSGIDRSPFEPCYGYTLRKKGNPFSDKWFENNGKIEKVRTTDNFDIKIVGSESAYIINNPIDPAVYAL